MPVNVVTGTTLSSFSASCFIHPGVSPAAFSIDNTLSYTYLLARIPERYYVRKALKKFRYTVLVQGAQYESQCSQLWVYLECRTSGFMAFHRRIQNLNLI